MHTDVSITKSERDGEVFGGLVRIGSNPSGSRPNFFGRQHLTFDKGRAWMPEVERPEFRKDAKPTERSYGKSVGGFRGIVRFWARVANDKNIKKAVTAYYCNRFY